MIDKTFDIKDKENVKKLFSEFNQLVEEHDLNSILMNTQDLMPLLNVTIDDKVIAVEVDKQRDGYQHYIVVRVYYQHGIKFVLKVGSEGLLVRWIEGINEAEVYCGQ